MEPNELRIRQGPESPSGRKGALGDMYVPDSTPIWAMNASSRPPDATNITQRGRHAAAVRARTAITVATCFISQLAIRSVEREICPIAKSGVKYDVIIVFLDHDFL